MKFTKLKKTVLATALVMAATTATAADNFIEVGADAMLYNNDFKEETSLDSGWALNARWGTLGNTGLYAWGSYEQPDVKYSREQISRIKTWGVGGGLRVPFDNGVYVFTELGYYFPSDGKGIDINYDGDIGGSIGAGYDINDNWTVSAKYRILKLDAQNEAGANAVSNADMSAIAIGVNYRF